MAKQTQQIVRNPCGSHFGHKYHVSLLIVCRCTLSQLETLSLEAVFSGLFAFYVAPDGEELLGTGWRPSQKELLFHRALVKLIDNSRTKGEKQAPIWENLFL